jgi:hypothetical protein
MKLLNKTLDMPNLDNIPEPIKNVLDAAATEYSQSEATTNAGKWLRFICRFIKPSTIIKMFAHKISR